MNEHNDHNPETLTDSATATCRCYRCGRIFTATASDRFDAFAIAASARRKHENVCVVCTPFSPTGDIAS